MQVDPSLVLKDVKKFSAEVINGIKRMLTIEIENGDHNTKTCSIELLEPPGKNISKVTWNDCVVPASVHTDSEGDSLSAIPGSEVVPQSITTDSEVVSLSDISGSELVPPLCITTDSEVVSLSAIPDSEVVSPPTTTDSEVSTTEQQSVDHYTTVSDNIDTNNDDLNSRSRRETLELRGFSNVGSRAAEELGKFALDTLDAIDADSNKRVVEKIQSAQKELVDGLPLYEIVMLVRETQCPENSSEDCTYSSTDPQQLCSVMLQSSLDNKSPAYARVIKSECNVADPVTINNREPEQ